MMLWSRLVLLPLLSFSLGRSEEPPKGFRTTTFLFLSSLTHNLLHNIICFGMEGGRRTWLGTENTYSFGTPLGGSSLMFGTPLGGSSLLHMYMKERERYSFGTP